MFQQYINHARASIANLSTDELKQFIADDEKVEERVNDALGSLEAEKDSILSENRSTAEDNLSKELQLIELRGKINELTEEGKEICASIQTKLTDIKQKSGNISQDTALALLQTAAAESEEESEKYVKDLLENVLPLETFLDQFLVCRKTMHLRKIKADKMLELIRQPLSKRNSYIGPTSTGFYPNPMNGGIPYPTTGSVPYPLGPMPMPMPGIARPF